MNKYLGLFGVASSLLINLPCFACDQLQMKQDATQAIATVAAASQMVRYTEPGAMPSTPDYDQVFTSMAADAAGATLICTATFSRGSCDLGFSACVPVGNSQPIASAP